MANRLKMAIVQSILSLHAQGWSGRRIAVALEINRETVAHYIQQQQAAGSKPANAPISPAGSAAASNPATAPTGLRTHTGSGAIGATGPGNESRRERLAGFKTSQCADFAPRLRAGQQLRGLA